MRHGCNSDGVCLQSMYVERSEVDDYSLYTVGPSLTKQEFAEECDINALMDQYERTGVMSHVARSEPRYLDVSDVPDLQLAMQVLRDAEEAFMSLPAKVRATFDNDASKFVAFAEDSDNVEQMRAWGLAKPAEPPPPPVSVRVIADPVETPIPDGSKSRPAPEGGAGGT